MKSGLRTIAAMIVAVAALAVPAGAADKIQIGSILPLSGDYAQWGEQERKGIQLGLEALAPETRAMVDVVFYDHEAQAEKALDALKQMQSRGIRYCAEIMSSGISLYASDYFNERKILVVSGANTLGTLTQKGGPYFYRVIPSDALAARGLAAWASKRGWTRSVVVTDISDWGQGLQAELEKSLRTSGGTILETLQTREAASDFSAIVAAVGKSKPDVVFLLTYPREAALIVKELGAMKDRPAVMGTDNFTNDVLIEASNMQLDRVFYVVPKESDPKASPEYAGFVERYQKSTGDKNPPPPFLMYGYDVIRVIAEAVKSAGNDSEKARAVLNAMEFPGASGTISFDENGDLKRGVEYGLMGFKIEESAGKKVAKRVPVE